MKRFMFRAQLKSDHTHGFAERLIQCKSHIDTLVKTEILMTASLYRWENQLFLYYECIDQEIAPAAFLCDIDGLLEHWPAIHGEVSWVPMIDIFHFDIPLNQQQWKRNLPVDKRVGKLARIRSEMLSSYIYYHYSLQEAQRDKGNKYCVIGLYENFIFLYEESPAEFTTSSFVGKLETKMQVKNWQDLMYPHFIPWPDVPDTSLRDLETLLSI